MTQVLQVFIFQDGQFLGTEMATGDRIEIGRDPSCGIRLDDESCSRKHALLFFHDGQLAIQDLGSANGTMLNKQPITGPRLVSSRDEVGIGRYQIKLKSVESQLPQAAGAEPPTQALIANPALSSRAAPKTMNVGLPQRDPSPVDPSAPRPLTPAPMTDASNSGPNMAAFSSEEGDPTIIESPGADLPLAARLAGMSVDNDVTLTAGPGLATRQDSSAPASSMAIGGHPGDLSNAGPLPTIPPNPTSPPGPSLPTGSASDVSASLTPASPGPSTPSFGSGSFGSVQDDSPPPSPVGMLLDDLTLGPDASAPIDPLTVPRADSSKSLASPKTPPIPDDDTDGLADALEPSSPSASSPSASPSASSPAAPSPSSSSPIAAASASVAQSASEFSGALEASDGAEEPLPVVNWVPGSYEPEDVEADDVTPGWSLVQKIVRAIEPEPEEKVPAVEVIHYRGEQVFDQATLLEGDTYSFGSVFSKEDLDARGLKKPIEVVAHRTGNVGEVVLIDGLGGKVLRNGQQLDVMSLPESKGKKIPLTDGDLASLEIGGDRLFIRFARAVNLPLMEAYEEELKRERKRQVFAAAAAVLFILVGGVTSWIYQYRALNETVIQLEDDGFADVKKELELEFKKPKKKNKPKKVELPAPKKEETKVAAKPEPVVAKESDVGGKKEAPKKPGVLDALKNLPKRNAGAQSLTKALSNVKGVKVPGASGYKVSAMTAKGVKGVSIGGASGGVDTSSLNRILRKGGGGNGPGTLAGRSTKRVKGRVKTLKRKSKVKGQGTLSREAIQKVVRALVGKIQYCYEKQLRTNSSLAGKVVLEWTIKPSGRVGVVKTGRGTSLKSAAAINCMQRKLKAAQFPKPKGGSVIVTYPFIFNTI